MLFVVTLVFSLAAPVLDLAGTTEPTAVLDRRIGHALGPILFFSAIIQTFLGLTLLVPNVAALAGLVALVE